MNKLGAFFAYTSLHLKIQKSKFQTNKTEMLTPPRILHQRHANRIETTDTRENYEELWQTQKKQKKSAR